jgi:hypothetical protein
MREVEVSDIERYVHRVSTHPFENIDELANIYFEDCSSSLVDKEAIMPELLNIPLTKRSLVVNIVRDRMNYDISPIDEQKINILRDKGEKLEPVFRPEISTVKEIDFDENEEGNDTQK